MTSKFKIALLSSVALAAIAVAAPESANAQMYTTGPGFYLSVEGRYVFNETSKIRDLPFGGVTLPFTIAGISTISSLKEKAGNGWGGKAMLGYRFNNNWDVGVVISGALHKNGKGSNAAIVTTTFGDPDGGGPLDNFLVTATANQTLKVKLDYHVGDFEAGYNWKMGNSNVRLFGGVAAALLYGKFKDTRTVNAALVVGLPTTAATTLATSAKVKDKSKNKFVPNFEGEVGLGYTFGAGSGSAISIQAGYRADLYMGAASDADVYAINAIGLGPDSKSADYLFHGPFVRLTATFGAATPVAAAPPPAPAPAPMPKKNFLVFFDFDRSNITADAQRVITEAAAAAKAGNVSRIQLTGHTDRSGSDQYNMALSLRRGEAVKQALIRQGIPAASIAVIGRGESQPLVPTADGVREPQNRRVEILL